MDTCPTLTLPRVNPPNILTLQLSVRQDEVLKMPEHAGSMLRGAFGVALRSLTCITDLSDCKQCSLKQHCKFPRLFESPALQAAGVQAVNPYVIHVPITPKLQSQAQSSSHTRSNHLPPKHTISYTRTTDVYKKGDIWHFGMTLMGAATHETDLIIKAWQVALQTGLGAHAPYQRATLIKAMANDSILYRAPNVIHSLNTSRGSNTQASISNAQANSDGGSRSNSDKSDRSAQLTLRFLTPFRYQQNNRIISQANRLDSITFIASLYNRIRLCQDNHSPNQTWDIGYDCYHDFKAAIATLDIEVDIAANHVARRSNRQQRKMQLYGLQGDIHLLGDAKIINSLLPALQLGEQLHIGKNTTMGLGQYQLILLPKENTV